MPEASLLASEVWLLAGPVVVTLVTKVEPLDVIDDATTPVVTEPDKVPEAPVPEAETPEAEKAVLVTVEAMTLPLWVTVVSKVAVEMGIDPLPAAWLDSFAVVGEAVATTVVEAEGFWPVAEGRPETATPTLAQY